ncbi:lytic transglycosylase domain-containing protein [Mesorhizobium sp. KR9-304]|uniref:lytic transglycosylase domain-containing protein n=1 Tax=Mesorhizobium sp. KR9-304 TaxID=3156614 RepID=UPI0032B4FE1A
MLAIVFADFGDSIAHAGEKLVDPARFAYASGGSHGLATSVRQGQVTGDDEYSLTPTGAIVPTSFGGSGLPIGETHQYGVPFGSWDLPADQLNNSNHIGNDIVVEPHACGPSPLTSDEIRELVIDAARRHNVDQDLAVAVASAESDFDRNRNSPKGARGPMQLMPGTAARFGVSDPCEPTGNIDAGIRYLGLLLAEFKNPMLAIAAYNAGEDRIYEYGGIPPFPETVSYVAKVVSHQLGLPMPRRDRARGRHRAATDELSERGVVMTDKRRQWIAGVMQF